MKALSLAAFAFFFCAGPAFSALLLQNAGFQFAPDGTTNANPQAQYWTLTGEGSRENLGSQDSDGWLASLHGWGSVTTGAWEQSVSGSAGGKYLLSGYFSADTNYTFSGIFLKLKFLDAGSALLGAVTSLVSGVGPSWAYYEVEGRAPTGTTQVAAEVSVEGQGTAGSFKFDAMNLSTQAEANLARLEPARGCLAGVNLDWDSESPLIFNTRIGWDHTGFVDFTDFPRTNYSGLDAHVGQVRNVGGQYVATLEPSGGLSSISSNDCAAFAGWCAYWNGQGVPIFVRFAHEMNGDWYAWKMRPALYREKFRLLANVIHGMATNTALVWAPNVAGSYPYGVFNGMTQAAYISGGFGTLADWFLLDSNGDGVLQNGGSLNDDPYAPFYPGDSFADWVGMTVYHWGSVYPWWYNAWPERRKFSDLITGNYNGFNGNDSWNPDFYAVWAEGRGKPMMIPETAAYYRPAAPIPPNPFYPQQQTNSETAIKVPWLEQLFNIYGDNTNALDVSAHFPRIKAINWFNHYKIESEAQNDYVNWTVTSNTAVRDEYLNRLRAAAQKRRYFLHAEDLKNIVYGWNATLDGWTAGGAPFTVSVSTTQPHEGRACLRADYTNTAPPYGVTVAADYSAIADPYNAWSNGNAIHVRARVPSGPAWSTLRLAFQSAQTNWDPLASTSCAPDGVWRNFVFPYQWSRHSTSAWLNIYLQIDLPTNTPATVFMDELKVVVDSNTNGIPAGEEADDDSDGMPDEWEMANGLNPRLRTDGAADSDNDGFSNFQEFIAGTNPQNPASFLRLLPTPGSPFINSLLRWAASTGIVYLVQACEALTGNWYDVSGAVTTDLAGIMTMSNIVDNDTGIFYRLSAGAANALPQRIDPYDSRLAYHGRFDTSSPFGPSAAWSASEMQFRFDGTAANLLVREARAWPNASNPQAGNYLAISVDGAAPTTLKLEPGEQRYRVADGLSPGAHAVRVVKRTEALVGDVQFVGVELPANGLLLPPSNAPARRIEFIGDSVTSGYGNEAPGQTNTFHPATENAWLTFGALAGRALTSDYRLISWSGKGVWRNGDGTTTNTMSASGLYPRTLPRDTASAWTFTNWTPQTVVINLGVNDFAVDTPPRDAFCAAYSNLVDFVRATYGNPHIFCCISSTPNDFFPPGQNRRTTMRTWLTDLVNGYVAQGQTNTYFHEFLEQLPADGYGADFHPSLITHQKMADQIVTAVVQRVGW